MVRLDVSLLDCQHRGSPSSSTASSYTSPEAARPKQVDAQAARLLPDPSGSTRNPPQTDRLAGGLDHLSSCWRPASLQHRPRWALQARSTPARRRRLDCRSCPNLGPQAISRSRSRSLTSNNAGPHCDQRADRYRPPFDCRLMSACLNLACRCARDAVLTAVGTPFPDRQA